MELDYSTDVTLTIGFLYNSSGVAIAEAWVVLVPTTDVGGLRWNKMYIDVSAFFDTGKHHATRFLHRDRTSFGTGTGQCRILDNFKLVRRDQ